MRNEPLPNRAKCQSMSHNMAVLNSNLIIKESQTTSELATMTTAIGLCSLSTLMAAFFFPLLLNK